MPVNSYETEKNDIRTMYVLLNPSAAVRGEDTEN